MLGLGLGLNKATKGTGRDLILDVDESAIAKAYFSDYNINNGFLTKTTGETVGGESGWTKYVYPSGGNETDISGLFKSDLTTPGSVNAGLFWDVQFEIYLEGSSNWLTGEGNTEVTTQVNFGNTLVTNEVTPGEIHTFTLTTPATVNAVPSKNFFIAWQTTNDLPQAGATFYLKDFRFKLALNSATANIT